MEIKKITGDSFQTEVTEAGMPVVAVFCKEGDDLCKAQIPILEEAAKEACDVRFCLVNADDDPALVRRFEITVLPTMLILNGEKIFRKITGYRSLEYILDVLEM